LNQIKPVNIGTYLNTPANSCRVLRVIFDKITGPGNRRAVMECRAKKDALD